MKYGAIFLILLIPLASSLDVDFSCPKSADYLDELSCFLEISNVTDVYDIKVYITGDAGGINQIYDGAEYRRSDWYLKEWINESGYYEVRLKIHKEYTGVASGEFKLRDSSGKIEVFEIFEMDIGIEEEEILETPVENETETHVENETIESLPDETINESLSVLNESEEKPDIYRAKKVINLSPYQENDEDELIYVSKSEKSKEFLIYAFFGFLIVIILVFLLNRRW